MAKLEASLCVHWNIVYNGGEISKLQLKNGQKMV
jgi:hypothetical protein